MKINDLLNKFEKAIKNNNQNKIDEIKQQIIHPNEGSYFAIFVKYPGLNTWVRKNIIYDTRQQAENALMEYKKYMYNCLQQQLPYDEFEIRRVVVHETDITNYL